MPWTRVELALPKRELTPQASASTNSATRAFTRQEKNVLVRAEKDRSFFRQMERNEFEFFLFFSVSGDAHFFTLVIK